MFAVGHDQVVRGRDHDAAKRSDDLCVPDHRLALLGIGKQFRQPGDRGDELDAHADERAAPPEEQPRHGSRIAGGERRERVEQDAPDEHAPPAEQVGQIPAEQAEDAARHGGHVEDDAHPVVDEGAARRHVQQLDERRAHDERQHQQHVGVEREADGRDNRDQPLQRGQTCGTRI